MVWIQLMMDTFENVSVGIQLTMVPWEVPGVMDVLRIATLCKWISVVVVWVSFGYVFLTRKNKMI
jgi:hypothetical protein